MDGTVIYDIRIIVILGAVLLVSAFFIMLLYPQPLIRYGLLLILTFVVVWKRKVLFGLIQTLKDKR